MNRPTEENTPRASETAEPLTPEQARELLAAVPDRPRRRLGVRDHLSALATIGLSFLSGLLALSGHPWLAIPSALVAVIVASHWTSHRKQLINEPRLGPITVVSALFSAWLVLPIYRAIRFGDAAPFPELLVLGGLAPAAWLGFYIWLLIRR